MRKKYFGSSILMNKVNRSKYSNIIIDDKGPGPGAYEIGSAFDKYADQL